MDAIISAALEEICSQGQNGLSLSSLWSILNTDSSLKASVYSNLLKVPSLQFLSPKNATFAAEDAAIQRLEDAEKLGLKIVASSQLRDNFVGLYDRSSNFGLSASQRRVLERLATTRSNGIAQSQLAKEFGIEGNNFFYIVKNLECKGLIVRQPAVLRTREADIQGEVKNSSIVTTNLIYLSRYAKHLGTQQRFEVTKEETVAEGYRNENEKSASGGGFSKGNMKENVDIKDFLPAIKAVCDKLEEANGKVLVVTDIKQDLGYCGSSSGHKAWRNICQRLTDAGVIEEFDAKLSQKVERCLRLVKCFSPKLFEPKSLGCGDRLEKEQLKFGRRLRKTEQLVELPIDHQIYDMVDAEGSEGLAVMEVCDRLGLDKKKSYPRFCNMFSRFGMHLQAENHKKTVAYRVWTSGNSSSRSSNAFISKSNVDSGNLDDDAHRPSQTVLENAPSTSGGDSANPEQRTDADVNFETSLASGEGENNQIVLCPEQEFLLEQSGMTADGEFDVVNTAVEENVPPAGKTILALSKPLTNPSPFLTPNFLRREQRVLERLQDERFILRSELIKWLSSLEDTCTTVDRKVVGRILARLQQQGHCKCMNINVPVVTNCSRSRITQVVLHPSVQSLTPDLLSEIHDRMRNFELQVRGRGSSKWKKSESVPVLDGVQRIHSRVDSDEKAIRSETMRANGFVLAKMVRAKLLHSFLWDYLSSSCGWDDDVSSKKHVPGLKNSTSSCYLFSLEAAIKNIPLELFLQVVGSTQKFDDMIQKCKRGLCLSDLSTEEYRLMMNTQATGRLSLIVDLLRRLKLIRLANNGHPDNGSQILHANLTHALELKPYIEEPPTVAAVTNSMSLDLRPRIRHDFVFSNTEAVNEYWQTLEYCYAAADPGAASHAFPGSAVHEIFHYRSWASVRVLTADQRAELLKRIVKDNSHERIPFRECEKIAKDLNLTLEQVLRVYYDKRHIRLKRFQGASDANEECQLLKNKHSSSQKRKKALEKRSVKRSRVDAVTRQLDWLTADASEFVEEQNPSAAYSGEIDSSAEDDHLEMVEELESNEEDKECSLLSQLAFSKMRASRQKRFSWTEEADRQLVIQYVRHRAALGAKFHRVDWASLPNLPATPGACARRMSLLKKSTKFRKAVMNLCNMLSERYATHLVETENVSVDNSKCRVLKRSSLKGGLKLSRSNSVEHTEGAGFGEKRWDDFADKDIESALEGVLRLKQMTKLEASEKHFTESDNDSKDCTSLFRKIQNLSPLSVYSSSSNWSGGISSSITFITNDNLEDSGFASPSTFSDQNLGMEQQKDAARRTKCHHQRQKITKLLNERINSRKEVSESLAVSSAIELFKIVFLSTSTEPEPQNLLAETLRRYSEHDLFAAFSYLRERKFMIGGNGNPFVLSQLFLQSLSKCLFPINTGKRAAKFSSWLHEKEKDLMEGGIDLKAELQCGDVFHLLSLVSSGELSIFPRLPEEGVGEADDLRCLKRKHEDDEPHVTDKSKKLKSLSEGELVSRREKGFPGIIVSVRPATISVANAVETFKDGETYTGKLHGNVVSDTTLERNGDISCQSDYMKEIIELAHVIPIVGSSSETPWDAMTAYAEYLNSNDRKQVNFFCPQVFENVYSAIQKAGDQGLSIKEISHAADMPEEKITGCVVDVLQAFGRALKVNAYDTIRVVDVLYRSKYFLTSMAGFHQGHNAQSLTSILSRTYNRHLVLPRHSSPDNKKSSVDDVHKVTILNLPEDVSEPLDETETVDLHKVCMLDDVFLRRNDEEKCYSPSLAEVCTPILPWINGDGTVNSSVYNGLLRRVFGTVMQHPGILQDEIIRRTDVVNPQSCKKLLELMILDGHLTVKKMHQTMHSGPPALLGTLSGSSCRNSKMVYREHFFANPKSMSIL